MPNLLPNTLDVNIVRLYKALYDQAPGYTYLTAFRELGSVQAVSAALNKPFEGLSNTAWATKIADGLHLTGAARTTAIVFLEIQQNLAPVGVSVQQHRANMLPGLLLGYADNYETQPGYETFAAYFNRSVQTSFEFSRNPANTTTNTAVLALADEPNSAPTAGNDAAAATEGGSLVTGSLRANDSDAESDPLTYSLAATQAPVPGLTLASNGGFTFDPTNPAYDSLKAGEQRQIVVNVAVSDGEATSNSTLTITVTGTNDAPMAGAAVASVAEDGSVAISIATLTADPDGDTLGVVFTQPLHGVVTYNATTRAFTYTPTTNYIGTDSFAYTVSDPSGAAATNTITLSVTPVNDAPVARAISGTGPEDSAGITLVPVSTDVDAGDTVTYAVATQPANGTVSFNGTNFVFVPAANFNGTTTFTYSATDGAGASSTATATVIVTPVNDAPVANSQTLTTNEDNAVSGTLTSSDIDVGDTKSFSMNTQASNGTVTITNATTGAFTYTPNLNFNGTDSFTFRVTDSGGASATATVIVNVTPVNDAPVPANLAAVGFEDQVVTGRVQAVDADGDTLTYSVATPPSASQGTVTMNPDGTFSFTPAPNYYNDPANAADVVTFTYSVSDGTATVSTGTVTIKIAQVDDVLTTGIDAVVGSVKDDRVLGNQATLNAGDSINGGAGNDSVIISLESLAAPGRNFASFTLTGVELFQVTNDGGANATFDMSSSDGVQTLRSTNSTASVAFNYANTVSDSDADGFDEINLQVLNLTEGVNVVLDVRNDQAAGFDEVNLSLTDSDDDGFDANEISIVSEAVLVTANLAAVDEATASGVELVNINTDGSDGSVWVNDLNTPGTTTINIRTAVGLTIGDDANGNGTFDDANDEIINPLSSTVSVVDASTSTAAVFLSTGDNNGGAFITGGSGSDRFELGSGNDTVVSGAGNDSVYAEAGHDSVIAGEGNDVVRAGEGNNTVDGGAGNDNVRAGAGNDSIIGGTGNDTIAAGDGANSVSGGTGTDQITVGTGNDTVTGGADNDTIDFSAGGGDIISGDDGNDVLNGGAGLGSSYTEGLWADGQLTTGELGADQVDGGAGNDTLNLTGDSGDDNDLDSVRNVETINFTGEDWDIAVFDGSFFDTDTTVTTLDFRNITGRVVFDGNDDAAGNNDFFGVPVPAADDEGLLSRAITVLGSGGNDTINTGEGGDSVQGNGGDDVISTTLGNDTVRPGTDASNGGAGDSVDLGAGDDVVIYKGSIGASGVGELDVTDANEGGNGGVGNDIIQVEVEDYLIGGGEVSTAVLGAGTSNIDRLKLVDLDNDGGGHRVDVTLDAGYAQTMLIIDAEDLDSDEQLNLNASANAANENLNVIGGAGNDTINMGRELGIGDTIDGNNGTDDLRVDAPTGVDPLVDADLTNVSEVEILTLTNAGGNTATLAGEAVGAGILTVLGAAGPDSIHAGAFGANLTVTTGGANDTVLTGTGNDVINGGDGNDSLTSGDGNDSINAGSGDDVVDAGANNDTIDGLLGNDNVSGGTGNDLFVGYGTQVDINDTITGSTSGANLSETDTLHLSDAQGNVSADISLPNVTFIDNIVAVDADNDGLGNTAHVTDIDFVLGSVNTITVINVSGRGFDGTTNGTATVAGAAYGAGGDSLNIDLSAIGDKDYAFNITGGLGNDVVTGSALPENLNFQAGGGNDWLNVDATDLGTTLTMYGGAGVDTINMISGVMTDDSFDDVREIEVLRAHNGGIVAGTNVGAGDAGINLAVVPLNAALGEFADRALDESTQGYISVVGTSGADSLLLDAAFNDAVRVDLSANGADTVNAGASSSQVIIIADAADITAADTLRGGTGNTDAMWLTADNGSAVPTNASGFEAYTIVESGDASATLTLVQANFDAGAGYTGVASGIITVSAAALDDTTPDGTEGSFTLNAGTVTTGRLSVTGGTGADTITTGSGADTIDGGADSGIGSGAADSITSGAGNDSVTTRSGSDWISAGDGDDVVNAGNGNNTVFGGIGNDTLTTGSGADSVEAGDGNDRVTVGAGNDTVYAGVGDDSVEAGDGNDQIRGDNGNDTLNGGNDADTLIGGIGADNLTGGAGADVFVYETRAQSSGLLSATDTITDFGNGADQIDFRLIGLGTASAGFPFAFAGNGVNLADAQSGTIQGNGIIEVVYQQDEQMLWVDLNDNGSLDNNDLRVKVQLVGRTTMNGGDFVGVTIGTIEVGDGGPHNGNITNESYTHVGSGTVTINGGEGGDTINGSATNGTNVEVLNGDGGNDSILGNAGNDVLNGGVGADTLTGGAGDDTMTGGPGADVFVVDGGTDTIVDYNPGEGDTMIISAGATAVINGTGGNDTISGAGITNNGTLSITGGGGADSITGSTAGSGINVIDGGAGNDTITGGANNDSLTGGTDNDSIVAGDGADTVDGGDGDDVVTGGNGADSLMGGTGNDTIFGKSDDVLIDGGVGAADVLDTDFDDSSDGQITGIEIVNMSGTELILDAQTESFTINGSAGNDSIVSGSGNDTINGNNGADTIDGGAGTDSITGGAGADSVMGGAGNDTLVGASDDALLDGGADTDLLQTGASFDDSGDGQVQGVELVKITVTTGGMLNLASQTENFTSVSGNTGNDTIVSGQGADSVQGFDGDDSIDAGGGNDTVRGGEQGQFTADGNDYLAGGDGDDTMFGMNGNDTLAGGSGIDTFNGEDGDDVLIGDDNDALFNGGSNTATGDTLQTDGSFDDFNDAQIVFVERVTMASSGTLTVSDQTESLTIVGSGGADTIIGADNGDDINGGNGADSITGGPDAGDADTINGGDGNDTIVGDQADASIIGGNGTDTLQIGTAFNDTSDGQIATIEVVTATADALVINFGDQGASEGFTFNGFVGGSSTITGGAGNDTFVGDSGADSFVGGGGADVIGGGGGNDTLTGGAGNDSLTGAGGDDTYNVDAGTDTITFADWANGTNVLVTSVGAVAKFVDSTNADALNLSAGVTNNGGISIEGGAGADAITSSTTGSETIVGGAGADTITTGAGTDTVVLDMSGATYDTVTDFDVATDILGVGQTGTLQSVVDAGSTTDLAVGALSGHVVVIANATVTSGQLTNVTNNGIVENRISGAIENVKPVGSAFPSTGGTFTVILSDGTDSGVYKVTVTTIDADLGTEDFSIQLVGLLQGVDQADLVALTDGNIG